MSQLREFAQHSQEFEKLHVRVVGISVDPQEDAHKVWDKQTNRKFTILSDPGAVVTAKYGLLHAKGAGDSDIAIRTTLYIGPDGKERWRRVSDTVPDIPKASEVLARLADGK